MCAWAVLDWFARPRGKPRNIVVAGETYGEGTRASRLEAQDTDKFVVKQAKCLLYEGHSPDKDNLPTKHPVADDQLPKDAPPLSLMCHVGKSLESRLTLFICPWLGPCTF